MRAFDGSEHSGDFVKCIPLDPKRQAFVVGDVVGRGAYANEIACSLEAYIRSALFLGLTLSMLVEMTDRFLFRRASGELFASLFIAIVDSEARTMTYVSAGHEAALLCEGSRHEHLDPTGRLIGLGLTPGTRGAFRERSICLGPSYWLVVVTDGITDARPANDRGSFFGTTGVVRAIRSARADRRNPACAVHFAATEHAMGPLDDDASVLVADFSNLNSSLRQIALHTEVR
jgi:sigma-B regulation protein RsbU (phosphoserine phosphatase)